MNRRKLIIGGACLIAAPAIVRYSSLMPVKLFYNQKIQIFLCKALDPDADEWLVPIEEDAFEKLLRKEVLAEINHEIVRKIRSNMTMEELWTDVNS